MEPLTRHRKPIQERSRERVERVIAAAEDMLMARGPEETSIPEIAEVSGVTRASIYQFFPSKYALFLAIAEHHLNAVADLTESVGKALADASWETLVEQACRGAAAYYNRNPVASMLILGGPMSRNAYLAQETTIQDIGRRVRDLFRLQQPETQLPDSPDVTTLAVEIAFACMRHGYLLEARISDQAIEQARLAATSYLKNWLG